MALEGIQGIIATQGAYDEYRPHCTSCIILIEVNQLVV